MFCNRLFLPPWPLWGWFGYAKPGGFRRLAGFHIGLYFGKAPSVNPSVTAKATGGSPAVPAPFGKGAFGVRRRKKVPLQISHFAAASFTFSDGRHTGRPFCSPPAPGSRPPAGNTPGWGRPPPPGGSGGRPFDILPGHSGLLPGAGATKGYPGGRHPEVFRTAPAPRLPGPPGPGAAAPTGAPARR